MKQTAYSEEVLRGGLEAILARHAKARPGEPFGRKHPLRALFETFQRALAESDAVRACPTIKVEWSAGMGGLARIPTVTFLDVRETSSARRGLHCAFLVREDAAGVYLVLIQGTADLIGKLKRSAGREALGAEAARLRERFGELASHGFRLDDALDLGSGSAQGVDYRHATVAYKLYEAKAIPDDAALEDDLATILQAYTYYVASKTDLGRVEPVTWVFQCERPLGDEMTCPVRQYADWIHAGDTAYLWEAGGTPGLVAIATVLSDPADDGESGDVRLRVDRRLPRRVTAAELTARPPLDSLPVLKASQGTNFPVTPEQARSLAALVAGAPAAAPSGRAPRARRPSAVAEPFDAGTAVGELVAAVAARGFVFEPWQVASYVTALRTKPFVILAGVSGTGKSRLPSLVTEATGGVAHLVPVRPDWTDSSEVLGYTDLQGRFRPGPLIEIAREAASSPETHVVCVLDEMNLARVEHYFAEVLSRVESRDEGGGGPLLARAPGARDAAWSEVGLPPNLAVVGTVNMDESTHGFSRKVLDRAFTIELSDVDLSRVEPAGASAPARPWPASAWAPRAHRLGQLAALSDEERGDVERTIAALTELNGHLTRASLQVGYRTRDEVALFLLGAREVASSFVTREGEAVDPLDLAVQMKVLPRIAGGSGAVRRIVLATLGWASRGKPFSREEDADATLDAWVAAGRPGAIARARYPRTAARLCLMWERLLDEGFTSFWA